MRILVVGGSGSGKSALAEQLSCQLSPTRTYVATMAGQGAEARARIARHRAQRAGLGFTTFECTDTLPLASLAPHAAALPSPGVVLLDDLGNFAANALFCADGRMRSPHDVCNQLEREILALSSLFEHTVVVGNAVGSEGPSACGGTRAWVRLTGTLCNRIAAAFDVVAEVSAGIPLVAKGALP